MSGMGDVYGFVLEDAKGPDGALRFLPQGCNRVLVYSDDGMSFHEESYEGGYRSDFDAGGALSKCSTAGKYKLDIAVRALFPRYREAKMRAMP